MFWMYPDTSSLVLRIPFRTECITEKNSTPGSDIPDRNSLSLLETHFRCVQVRSSLYWVIYELLFTSLVLWIHDMSLIMLNRALWEKSEDHSYSNFFPLSKLSISFFMLYSVIVHIFAPTLTNGRILHS